jgi:methylamine dehydrogenase heavy chain
MNAEANGVDGMHNAGGSEVWVFDPEARRRVLRIPLEAWGLSLAVSRGEEPKVLVTNPTDMSVEFYDGLTGSFIKNITGFGQETPLLLRGAQ